MPAIRLHYADLDKEGSGEAIESLVKGLGISCDAAEAKSSNPQNRHRPDAP